MRRSTLYIALFLILAGLTILVRNIFPFRFGTFSILFAEAVILLGIYLISGGGFRQRRWEDGSTMNAHGREQSVFFSTGTIVGSPQSAKYTVVFSSAVIELPEDAPEMVEITSIFSDTRVRLPKNRAVRVKVSATFGTANMPGSHVAGFGTREDLYGEGIASYLTADSVFGTIDIG